MLCLRGACSCTLCDPSQTWADETMRLFSVACCVQVSEAGKGGALTGHARMDKQVRPRSQLLLALMLGFKPVLFKQATDQSLGEAWWMHPV